MLEQSIYINKYGKQIRDKKLSIDAQYIEKEFLKHSYKNNTYSGGFQRINTRIFDPTSSKNFFGNSKEKYSINEGRHFRRKTVDNSISDQFDTDEEELDKDTSIQRQVIAMKERISGVIKVIHDSMENDEYKLKFKDYHYLQQKFDLENSILKDNERTKIINEILQYAKKDRRVPRYKKFKEKIKMISDYENKVKKKEKVLKTNSDFRTEFNSTL